ncbi:Rossmann-fold NAD(P)-binding domain-containing protein [Peribacillus butanolivorans]|uniref:hypothetical protein n=1 Tax=Peribacillus butanolivorans TaxID=421767 RepID=UPI001CC0950E|nr:hypothetical protein [Peribacillus butanolivorans]
MKQCSERDSSLMDLLSQPLSLCPILMAEDLKSYGITVNMLLPGGATITGMIPDEVKKQLEGKFQLLDPGVMAKPIVFLASGESEGITGERIMAIEFDKWLQEKGK